MPSDNTWERYKRFMIAVEKKYTFDAVQMGAIDKVMGDLYEKAPSKTNGGSGVADDFFDYGSRTMCSGMWCNKKTCISYNTWSVYNCSDETPASKCTLWKQWRQKRRSYPDRQECVECRYNKQRDPDEKGKYNCSCRAKVKPDYCPKTSRKEGKKCG